MRIIKAIAVGALLLSSATVHSAPMVFMDAMQFDQQDFGLIDFEAGQSSAAEIDNYLSTYNASLLQYGGSYFGTAAIGDPVPGFAVPISGTSYLGGGGGPGSYITMSFADTVESVGAFLTGWVSTGNPYAGGPGGRVRVTSGDGSVREFKPIDYLPATETGVNGFFGVTDAESGISEIQFIWNRDSGGLDDIYFANATVTPNIVGQVGIPFVDADSILLPTYSAVATPQPGTAALVGVGLLGVFMVWLGAHGVRAQQEEEDLVRA